MIYAYLQGGPADLQKHAIDAKKPPNNLLVAYMEPQAIITHVVGDAAQPVKKLRYVVVGGWGDNVTYSYDGEVKEIA